MQNIWYQPVTFARPRAHAAEATETPRLPQWMCAVQAILGYEWLVSGINKLTNPDFSAHLPIVLQHNLRGNPYGLFVMVIQRLVLPNHIVCAYLVMWGETAIGAGLLLGVAFWTLWPHARLATVAAWAACGALMASIALNLNDYLMAGYGPPWINPANAYAEGIRIDAVLPLLSVVLLGATISTLRAQRRKGI